MDRIFLLKTFSDTFLPYKEDEKSLLSYSSKEKTKNHLTLDNIYNRDDLIYYILNVYGPDISHWIESPLSLSFFLQILYGKTIFLVLAYFILDI